jgi:hypothetical protein
MPQRPGQEIESDRDRVHSRHRDVTAPLPQ